MKHLYFLLFGVLAGVGVMGQGGRERWFAADNPNIQYMGRIDFSNPKLPRFWDPGVVVRLNFRGPRCRIVLHDEVPDGKVHNYVVIQVGSQKAYRPKLAGRADTLTVLGNGDHLVTICKATEGISWIEFAGVLTDTLLPPPALPDRKIECIGNSITCGFGNDVSGIPCGQGEWYDQSNAWMSYGALTARALTAQWHLTAVSGIGLIHSCCKMSITMPEVYDRMDSRGNQGNWNFGLYQPDVVTICLGQNDGIQDSAAFCNAFVGLVGHLRSVYPSARIVLLTSPMGNAGLTSVLKRYIGGVIKECGDARVSGFFFSKQWSKGCAGHPDMAEHSEIAQELTGYLRRLMRW